MKSIIIFRRLGTWLIIILIFIRVSMYQSIYITEKIVIRYLLCYNLLFIKIHWIFFCIKTRDSTKWCASKGETQNIILHDIFQTI